MSRRVYDEKGTPADGSDDTIVSTTLRDTALATSSAVLGRIAGSNGANTATLVQNALKTWVPDYDLVLIILNEPGFGGCGGGGFQIVTLGSAWDSHGARIWSRHRRIADEYCQPGAYTGANGRGESYRNTNSATSMGKIR